MLSSIDVEDRISEIQESKLAVLFSTSVQFTRVKSWNFESKYILNLLVEFESI